MLDEPMTGLDPLGRKDVRDLILELGREGKTVLFSTHILPDVEMTCDRVAIVVGRSVRIRAEVTAHPRPRNLFYVKTRIDGFRPSVRHAVLELGGA